MKLSKLVYLCVKEAVYLDDRAFTYENFISSEGRYIDAVDYSQNIFNALNPINEAIARLQDLRKIQYTLKQFDVENGTIYIDEDVDGVLGVGLLTNKGYYGLAFTDLGIIDNNRVIKLLDSNINVKTLRDVDGNITDDANRQGYTHLGKLEEVYVAYFKAIPYFEEEDMQGTDDVELKDYNINDKVCNYIMEYAKGKLSEDIQPELAIIHLNRAENYFSNLQDYSNNPFGQRQVARKYRM